MGNEDTVQTMRISFLKTCKHRPITKALPIQSPFPLERSL